MSNTQFVQLQHSWTFHFESSVSKFTTFGELKSVQDFWRYWNNLKIEEIPKGSKLLLLKTGLAPEQISDPRINKKGGSWILTKKTQEASKIWLKCILALIGEQCTHNDGLVGTCIAIRRDNCIISIFNKSSDQVLVIEKTEKELMGFLEVPKGILRYQPNKLDDEDELEGVGIKLGDDEFSTSPFVQLEREIESEKNTLSTDQSYVSHRRSHSIGDKNETINDKKKINNINNGQSAHMEVAADVPILPKRHIRKSLVKRPSLDPSEYDGTTNRLENTEKNDGKTICSKFQSSEGKTTTIYSAPPIKPYKRNWFTILLLVLVSGSVVYVLLFKSK